MISIIPAPLVKDLTSLEEAVMKVEGLSKKIQIDVIDGKFAPTETVTPEMFLLIETTAELEAHLMVEEPAEWIKRCAEAGVTAVYGQVEKMSDKQDFITKAEESGMRTGLAYDLDTSVTGLDEWINLIDCVLLMSVKAGAQGQKFDVNVLEKIRQVRAMSSFVTITIDGGLNETNIKKCLEIGGEKMEFAVGSGILNASDPETVFRKLENVG